MTVICFKSNNYKTVSHKYHRTHVKNRATDPEGGNLSWRPELKWNLWFNKMLYLGLES